jgi:hypothetical protein
LAIPRTYSFDFKSSAVQDFILDGQQDYFEPSNPPTNFLVSGAQPKTVGTIASDVAGRNLLIPSCTVETYNVIDQNLQHGTGAIVGSFRINIPEEQPVTLTVYADLFVRGDAPPAATAAIIAAFNAFDPLVDGDPDDYMAAKLRAPENINIQPSMFRTNLFGRLIKSGASIQHTEEKTRKLEPYLSQGSGSVWALENGHIVEHPFHGDPGYLVGRKLTAVLVSSIKVLNIPAEPASPYKIVGPAADFNNALDIAANREAEQTRCSGEEYFVKNWKIATLLTFPEFMIVWRAFDVDLGCGVHVTLSYPVLEIRWSDLTLYAFARYPSDLGNLVEDAIVDCALKSALAGAVIGVAMGNFASAIAAFQALFTRCLQDKFREAIKCMMPGLAINTEITQQWHDI